MRWLTPIGLRCPRPRHWAFRQAGGIKQETQNTDHLKALVLVTESLFGLQRQVLKLTIICVIYLCIHKKNLNVYLYAESYDSKDPKETATDD